MIRNIILFIVFSSCSAKIIQYLNTNADFENYKSYVVISLKSDKAPINQEDINVPSLIEKAIVKEMSERDYVLNFDTPDLIIRYEIISSFKTEASNNLGYYSNNISIRTIEEAIILVEMIDAKTKKLVWQASYDVVDNHRKVKSEKKQKKIDDRYISLFEDMALKLFQTYPYMALNKEPNLELKNKK